MDPRLRLPRSSPRLRRRLKVTFLQAASFTSDIGGGGFATERLRIFPPGLEVEGTISAADREFPFSGRVAWARPGDAALSLRGRMGVQFTSIAQDFCLLAGCAAGADPSSRPTR